MVDVKHGDRVRELSLTRRIVSLCGCGSAVATVGPVGLVGASQGQTDPPVGRPAMGENRREACGRWHQNQRLRLVYESAEHPSHTDPRGVGSGRVLDEEK